MSLRLRRLRCCTRSWAACATIRAVTDSILNDVTAWKPRPLEPRNAIVFFDAVRVKIRDEGLVKNKAVNLAIGVRASGRKQVLGLWIEQTYGAKLWLRVVNEIKVRGTQDILIAVVDGLKDFPESIPRCFPRRSFKPVSCS